MPTAFGSLRDAVANANTGDTISLEALPAECKSTITLTNGAIGISQPDLMIKGPADRVDILYAGAGYDRLFNHSGTGTLELDHVNIAFGRPKGSLEPVFGGCIYSKGSVTLSHSGVYSCVADAPATFAGGGAIAANSVTLTYSPIDSNKVESGTSAAGGGIYVRGGTFISKYSRIDHNTLDTFGHGGGVAAYGNVIVAHSTISGNHAKGQVGGLRAHAQSGGLLVIAESTISGNSSESYVGGVDSDVASATIQNSTIAFNTAAKGKLLDGEHQAPGLNVQFGSVTLQSSLLAHNTYGAVENDFAAPQGVTVSGADNFIAHRTVLFRRPGWCSANVRTSVRCAATADRCRRMHC